MVGRRPNHAEAAMISLVKRLGYKQGKVLKTGVTWRRRSLKRADPGTGDFYNNCLWGPFPGKRGGIEMDLAFPHATLPGGVDIEIDGIIYHDAGKDAERDRVLEAQGWTVVRITTDQVYCVFVPLLTPGKVG